MRTRAFVPRTTVTLVAVLAAVRASPRASPTPVPTPAPTPHGWSRGPLAAAGSGGTVPLPSPSYLGCLARDPRRTATGGDAVGGGWLYWCVPNKPRERGV